MDWIAFFALPFIVVGFAIILAAVEYETRRRFAPNPNIQRALEWSGNIFIIAGLAALVIVDLWQAFHLLK
jgi:hypothetical protein